MLSPYTIHDHCYNYASHDAQCWHLVDTDVPVALPISDLITVTMATYIQRMYAILAYFHNDLNMTSSEIGADLLKSMSKVSRLCPLGRYYLYPLVRYISLKDFNLYIHII